jgi:hypothetical protein
VTDREKIIEVLRELAPNHDVVRVWGRLEGAHPYLAEEGNAWAADVEDLADLIVARLAE